MRAYSQLPMKILFIEFKFPSLFLGLLIFLAFVFSNNLYAHSFPVNHSSKTAENESNPLKDIISSNRIVWVQNTLIYNQDSLFIKQETTVFLDTIPHKKQKTKVYIASGTTIIHADQLQNASLVYRDESTPIKKVLKKEKKKNTQEFQTKTVPPIEKKTREPSIFFTSSKSKEQFSAYFGNNTSILLLSNSYKILRPYSDINLQYAITSKVSTIPYLETFKDWRIHTKSRERAPPYSISVLV